MGEKRNNFVPSPLEPPEPPKDPSGTLQDPPGTPKSLPPGPKNIQFDTTNANLEQL